MKGLRGTVWLLMGLCSVNFASPSFIAQNQDVHAETKTVPIPSQALDNLRSRLEHANEELDSIRAQMHGPLTTESRLLLSERIEHLKNELDCLKGDLASINQEQLGGPETTTPATSGCCFQKQEHEQTYSCTGYSCPTSLKVIRRQQVKDLVITVENADGKLSRGPNSFCVRFTDSRTNQVVDVGEVQLDVTLGIGHVKAMRAVAQINPTVKGLYCGQVNLRVTGVWELVLGYVSPAGRGKIRFVTPGS